MWRQRGLRAALVAMLVMSFTAGSHLSAGRTVAVPPTPTATYIYNPPPTWIVNQDLTVQIWLSHTVDGGTIELEIDGATYETKPVSQPGFTDFHFTPDTKKSYSLQAFYSGTANFAASQSEVASVAVVPPYPSSVTISGGPNPVLRNEDFTLTTMVTPNPGPGNVEWYDSSGNTLLATTAVDGDGEATWTTAFETPGTVYVYAKWTGNDNYSPRVTDNFLQVVVLGDSIAVSVSVPGAPVPPGEVTASVTLTPNPGEGVLMWRLCDWCQETEIAADPDGTTSIGLGELDVGSHQLFVRYPANGDWAESRGETTFSVWETTTTSISTDRSTAYVGELPIKLTGTVMGLESFGGQGTIAFLDDVGGAVVQLGPVAISASSMTTYQASFSSNTLRLGTHSIRAKYSGMDGKLGSTSAPVTVVVAADSAVHATFAPALAKFYPAKDGFKDTVKLGGVLSERATVTIKVYNSAGSVKRAWSLGTLNTGSFGVTWNGKTKAGTALPAGTYTVKAYLKDTHGHSRTITGKTSTSWRQVVWKSVSSTKYAEVGSYYVSEFGGAIYYSPDYPRGRILDSGEMIRDCVDCAFSAGRFVFTVVSTNALAYRHLYIEMKGHGFSDREHTGDHGLTDPRTGNIALINSNYPYDDPDVHWGIPFTSSYINSTHRVEAWIWMDQAWGDGYDLNWLRLTYQYAVWK